MKVGINNNLEALASKIQQNATQNAQQKQAGSASEVLHTSTRNAQAGVPVTVSQSVRSLDHNAKTSSDIDMAKVQAMRQAIADGSFRVNAEAIADKLLGDASLFLGAGRV
ncbi:MAG: flagellar biosynthesis anti-sigma factor FlgM [Comamonas sp.]|nr:flagellar biosynthesis anti-sigma factor FlgM [Comamonas sp.]